MVEKYQPADVVDVVTAPNVAPVFVGPGGAVVVVVLGAVVVVVVGAVVVVVVVVLVTGGAWVVGGEVVVVGSAVSTPPWPTSIECFTSPRTLPTAAVTPLTATLATLATSATIRAYSTRVVPRSRSALPLSSVFRCISPTDTVGAKRLRLERSRPT